MNTPPGLVIFTWVTDIHTDTELISPHHLHTTLNIQDGDIIEFMLENNKA